MCVYLFSRKNRTCVFLLGTVRLFGLTKKIQLSLGKENFAFKVFKCKQNCHFYMIFCPSRTRRLVWSVGQISQSWSLIFLRKTSWAGRSFKTRYKPAQASPLELAKMFPTACCVCAWESTQLISLRSDDCLGVQLKWVTIPNFQKYLRRSLKLPCWNRTCCYFARNSKTQQLPFLETPAGRAMCCLNRRRTLCFVALLSSAKFMHKFCAQSIQALI